MFCIQLQASILENLYVWKIKLKLQALTHKRVKYRKNQINNLKMMNIDDEVK